jgi:arylsulfatase A-like enzyme
MPPMRTALATLLILTAACAAPAPEETVVQRPNVLWVIWDTVRADRMSLYGYAKPTTPRLEQWAAGARVYEHCTSTAGQTVPSTASMFTGLFPVEHGANPNWSHLDGRFPTIAELFRDDGYRTYLFSANAYLSSEHNFHRGFDVEEHPWDAQYADEALRIVRAKLTDHANVLRHVKRGEPRPGDLKSAGALAATGLTAWLAESSQESPWFALLNYMEAHRPYIPPREYRERMLSPEQVADSYGVRIRPWTHTFGLELHSDEELELIGGTYDATLAELDDRFAELLAALDAGGHLDNTIVVLTSDHGEHLGDHHRLDHQFSLYEGLIRVPLVVHYPSRFQPGRDPRPVSGIDLFPTLLELAGIELPQERETHGINLLAPRDKRVRLAEYPVAHASVDNAARRNPDWDPSPWRRQLRAVYQGELKQIVADDGHRELYRFREDPGELDDLAPTDPATAERMHVLLQAFGSKLNPWQPEGPAPEVSSEQFDRLKALGYVGFE